MSTFVISCGGTGGHLSPGIALAEGLVERGHQCSLMISQKQVDSRLISNYPGLEFVKVSGIGFSKKPLGILKFFYYQLKAFIFGVRYLREKKPDMVIGFGGFTTVGLALASFFLGYPLALHEANRVSGKAIRFLSVLARRVYLPQGVELKSLPPKTIRHLGYPVRKDVRPMNRKFACKRLGIPPNVKRLLVIGGSQGASKLNQWVLDNFERLGAEGIDVYCVTGMGKLSQGKIESVSKDGKVSQAVFTSFVDSMSEVLSCSDLAISRAGAGTIAEFTRCYLPSILIPYPYSADGHQIENARFLERQGGCIMLDEEELDKLYDEVTGIIFNDWLLDKMQQNLQRTEIRNSLEMIADDLEALCAQNSPLNSPVKAS